MKFRMTIRTQPKRDCDTPSACAPKGDRVSCMHSPAYRLGAVNRGHVGARWDEAATMSARGIPPNLTTGADEKPTTGVWESDQWMSLELVLKDAGL